jgi:hypothetical protein
MHTAQRPGLKFKTEIYAADVTLTLIVNWLPDDKIASFFPQYDAPSRI